MTRARLAPRPGFTLVELLVVIGLILVLLGLTLAVNSSGITDSYKTISAADRVSGWMLIAKSKAQRDGSPRGVRFIVGANNQIKEAQYIEVPDSYAPLAPTAGILPRLLIAPPQNGSGTRIFVTTEANISDLQNSVFGGDLLSLPEFGTLHTITSIAAPNPAAPTGLPAGAVEIFVRQPALLPTPPGNSGVTYATTSFGFHRGAQPAIGEPTLQLTGDTCIDANTGLSIANVSGGAVDVLFAPSGEVLSAAGGRTVFWIRDVRLPTPRPVQGAIQPGQTGYTDDRTAYEAAGQMALVVVYSKTGAIATQPVVLPTANGAAGHNPHSATTDAVNTGL